MSDRHGVDVETRLSQAVGGYLLRDQDDKISEDEHLWLVCNWLAPLLNNLLRLADGWDRYKWVDAISPCTAEKVSKSDLEFTGLVIWGTRGDSAFWVDPFSATIHLSDKSARPIEYELLFANADRGLGKCPFGSSQDFPHVPVADWIFRFVSRSDEAGDRN